MTETELAARKFPSVRLQIVCGLLLTVMLGWMWWGPAKGTPPPIRDLQTPLSLAQVEPGPGLLLVDHRGDGMWGVQSSYSSDLVGALAVDPLSYPDRAPRRGDVVYFRLPEAARPNDDSPDPPAYEFARVVALPGETLRVRDG
ncbi:hypothetical protein [Cohnella sp. REN36]|uniref:hypothetical protein n=1 Tax=Cohnella sp. REN36 TaxID=2887347 RepID=UPI00351D7948